MVTIHSNLSTDRQISLQFPVTTKSEQLKITLGEVYTCIEGSTNHKTFQPKVAVTFLLFIITIWREEDILCA